MAGKKRHIRPFRVLAVMLGVGTLTLLVRFPEKAVSLERQQKQLEEAAKAYSEAQIENNRLTSELAESNTTEFIERTARREYGYCKYGEIIYQVGNLDEVENKSEFDVYGEE